MKSVRILPLLLAVCVLLAAVAVASLIQQAGGYDPEQYITLADYRHISLVNTTKDATDEEIEASLTQMLTSMATTEEVTDGAKTGDAVTVDYTGAIDGKESYDFTSNDTTVTLGEDKFLVPGLDPYLEGAKPNDVVTAELTVPEGHLMSQYVGKTVAFTVTVRKVVRTNVPELTDEFAKQAFDFDTADQFRAAFAEQFRQERAAENRATQRSDLWREVVDQTTVRTYPQKPLQELKEELDAQIKAGAADYETDVKTYLSMVYNINDDEAYEAYREKYAQQVLKQQMVLKAICKRENLTLTDEEYAQYVQQYLEAYNDETMTEQKLAEAYGGEEALREQFLLEKATDLIEQTAEWE